MILTDTDWIFIFLFWFYIEPITIFSSQFRLYTHNLSCFLLIPSFHNFVFTCFFTVVSQFLPVEMKTFTMFIMFLLAVLFPSFFGLPKPLFLSFFRFPNSLYSLSDMDASYKMLCHVWSFHTDLPYPIILQGHALPCSFVFYDRECHLSQIFHLHVLTLDFSALWIFSASMKFFLTACKAF